MEQEWQGGRRRLPGPGQDEWPTATGPPTRPASAWRDEGVRKTRLTANWTAAALIAGVAAASGYFVHAAATPAATPAGTSTVPGAANTPGAVTGTGHKPSVNHTLVTSGGSGVTVGSGGTSGSAGSWRDN